MEVKETVVNIHEWASSFGKRKASFDILEYPKRGYVAFWVKFYPSVVWVYEDTISVTVGEYSETFSNLDGMYKFFFDKFGIQIPA